MKIFEKKTFELFLGLNDDLRKPLTTGRGFWVYLTKLVFPIHQQEISKLNLGISDVDMDGHLGKKS